jgi:hypothetical protein
VLPELIAATAVAAEFRCVFALSLSTTRSLEMSFWRRDVSTSVSAISALLILALAGGCSFNDSGLGIPTDAGTGASTGATVCPSGVTEKGSWPAGMTATSCVQTCGPDGIGSTTCGQSDMTTCQAGGGCVCSTAAVACVKCAKCTIPATEACYQPTNATNPPDCAATVTKGGTCNPACSKHLCIQADGKTGCVCNAAKKYACAAWSGDAWK